MTDADAPALNELTCIISVLLSRAQTLIDVGRVEFEMKNTTNS